MEDNNELYEVLNVPLNYQVKSVADGASLQEIDLTLAEHNIKVNLSRIGKQFLTVGEELKKIRDTKLYKLRKQTFEDYCEQHLSLSRSTCYKFIQIYEFVATSPQGLEKYKQYSYSQLREMVSIPDVTTLSQITPGTTIKEIRKIKEQAAKPVVEQQKQEKQAERINKLDLYMEAQAMADADKQDLPKPLVLKNIKERLEFLDNFKTWKLIAYVQQIGLQIYSYPLKNGAQILAFYVVDSPYGLVQYTLYVRSTKHDYGYRFILGYLNLYWNSKNELIDWLTQHKNEIE